MMLLGRMNKEQREHMVIHIGGIETKILQSGNNPIPQRIGMPSNLFEKNLNYYLP